MEWERVLRQEELAEGGRQVVDVGGQAILLLRDEGQVYAVASACPHLRLPLKGAKIKDGTLECPWHHSVFDLETGDAVAWSPWPPAVGRVLGAISREKALPVFPTRIEDGWISVGIDRSE